MRDRSLGKKDDDDDHDDHDDDQKRILYTRRHKYTIFIMTCNNVNIRNSTDENPDVIHLILPWRVSLIHF